MIAKKLTRTVTLDEPLGDRKVVDTTGERGAARLRAVP